MASPIDSEKSHANHNSRSREIRSDVWIRVSRVDNENTSPESFWQPIIQQLLNRNREERTIKQLETLVRNRLGMALTTRWRQQASGIANLFIQAGFVPAPSPQASFAVVELRYGSLEIGLAISGISALGQAFGFGLDDLDAFLVFAFPEAFAAAIGDNVDISADYQFEVLNQHSSRVQSGFDSVATNQNQRVAGYQTVEDSSAKTTGIIRTGVQAYIQRNAASILLLLTLVFLVFVFVDAWKSQHAAFDKVIKHQADLLEIDRQRLMPQNQSQTSNENVNNASKSANQNNATAKPTETP